MWLDEELHPPWQKQATPGDLRRLYIYIYVKYDYFTNKLSCYIINQAHSNDWSYYQTSRIRILSEYGKGLTHTHTHAYMHSVIENYPILDQSYYTFSGAVWSCIYKGRWFILYTQRIFTKSKQIKIKGGV